jgi:hypothetical protein
MLPLAIMCIVSWDATTKPVFIDSGSDSPMVRVPGGFHLVTLGWAGKCVFWKGAQS